MTRPTNKLKVTVKNVENLCFIEKKRRKQQKHKILQEINIIQAFDNQNWFDLKLKWSQRTKEIHTKAIKKPELTCFLTPGNITINAKNNVANKMHTATIDTS